MSWFPTLCRNLGRTVHNVMHPDGKEPTDTSTQKQTLDHTVEEKKLDDRVTLRRTTIDEIEIRQTGSQEIRNEGSQEQAI
jgi:hypothetical protein